MSEIEKIFVLKTSELEQFRNVQQVIALKTIYRVASRNPSASWDELIDLSKNDLESSHERVRRGDKPIDEGMELQEVTPEEAEALQNQEEVVVEEEVVFEDLPPLPSFEEAEPQPEPYIEPEVVELPKDPEVTDDDDEEEEETLAAIRQFSSTGGVLGSAADFDS